MSKEFIELKNKTIFITGVAGFIGSNLAERLLKEIEGIKIVGLDNMNDYYDVRLKEYRLEKLSSSKTFSFVKGNLADVDIKQPYDPYAVREDAFIESLLLSNWNLGYLQPYEGYRDFKIKK